MRSKKFVLDANIWISYFIKKEENLLLDFVVKNKIILLICDELIVELRRALSYPQLLTYNIHIPTVIKFVKAVSVLVDIEYPIKNYIPEDADDDYIISLALQTNSGFIISGDKHILTNKNILETKYKKLKILTRREFEELMKL